MNYEHIDIDRMVMESHYLHALDIEDSQREGSLSDMERQDYINKGSKRGACTAARDDIKSPGYDKVSQSADCSP